MAAISRDMDIGSSLVGEGLVAACAKEARTPDTTEDAQADEINDDCGAE
jgi:hypothetical protein